MAPRTVYANLQDGLQNLLLWDQSLADMGNLGMIPCTAAGTNAVTLTPMASAFTPNVSSPPQQLQHFTFVAAATSTGLVTINGLKLYKEDGATQAAANDLLINVLYGIVYNSALNSSAGGYQIAFPVTSIVNPVISGATITGSTITTSTYNGNTWTAGTGTLTIAAGKTLKADNTLEFAGTDGTVMTFPTTSATIARTDAANTFTGTQTVGALVAATINGNTFTAGTGVLTIAAAKTLTTSNTLTLAGTDGTTITFPTTSATIARTDAANTFTGTQTIGALVATTINGNTLTTGTYTLTGTAGKTLNFTNTLTLSGTDSTTMTFPTTSATIARTDAGNTFTGTQTVGGLLANGTAGVGYTTGGGGAVTQLTNRATAVTINKPTGAITLFNAAGSTTAASFTVNNSTVAANDVIHFSQQSGTNLYNTFAASVTSGSFTLVFYTTGGTASDAPTFNFAVVKGSAS
jgi:hypothetical protein